jgi:fumarate reductase subunit C
MSPFWYLSRWPYFQFIIRETSAFFVVYFTIVMIMQICAIETGFGAYARFQAFMACPVVMVINAIALGSISFHAFTWFILVPRVFIRHTMGNILPDFMIAAPNFGAWLVASAVIAAFALRFF